MKTDNELIAEFMGWESGRYPNLPNTLHRGIGPYERGLHTDHLKYDTSWDWLIPVVEKITPVAKGMGQQAWFDISYSLTIGKIDPVYKRVVDFINWYNSVISPTGK